MTDDLTRADLLQLAHAEATEAVEDCPEETEGEQEEQEGCPAGAGAGAMPQVVGGVIVVVQPEPGAVVTMTVQEGVRYDMDFDPALAQVRIFDYDGDGTLDLVLYFDLGGPGESVLVFPNLPFYAQDARSARRRQTDRSRR